MKDIFDAIKNQAKSGINNEINYIKETIESLLTAENEFAVIQGVKLLNYLEQLSQGKIRKDNLESYIRDIETLGDLQTERDKLDIVLAGRETVDNILGIVVQIIKKLAMII